MRDVIDLTTGNRDLFLEVSALFGLDSAEAEAFASRIRAESLRGDEGRDGVRVIVQGNGPHDADRQVLEVLPDWAGRVTASTVVVREPTRPSRTYTERRPLEQTQSRSLRLSLTALWAFYALRIANGIPDARILFR